MRPDLTGQGLGAEFVRAGLRFAQDSYSPPAFRLTVATFNRRAIKRLRESRLRAGRDVRRDQANGDETGC